jgi:hypothetical protein
VVIELLVFGWTDIPIPDRRTVARFRGHETGGFTGIRNETFEGVPSVVTTAHHFQSRFEETRQLKQSKAQQAGAGQPATDLSRTWRVPTNHSPMRRGTPSSGCQISKLAKK